MAASEGLRLDPEREERELREYLGPEFDRRALVRYDELVEKELAEVGDETELYRTSRAYLYDLTAFAMTGVKLPYLRALTDAVPPGSRVLDYGCGIGSDGLMLLERGYHVEFADFDNPSVAYLRWRLAQRGFDVPVHDLDRDVPGGFDAAYAFDVLEHVPDPFVFIEQLESRAALVCLNILQVSAHEHELHHELPVKKLLLRAAARDLVRYERHHGSSHLVLYRPRRASVSHRLRSHAMLAGRWAKHRL